MRTTSIPFKLVLAVFSLSVSTQAFAADDPLVTQARKEFSPIPSAAPALKDNPATPPKVALGKMLYFDPRLSASHAISCNSCHNLGLGGADGQPTSIGHRWQHGGRNAPTVLNAVFNSAQFWDGRAEDLEHQAGGPIANPVEMASPQAHVAEQLKAIPGYRAAFSAAFPKDKDPITLANVQKAIAVFEAALITPNAPFDKFLEGQANALSSNQREGLTIFMNRGCSNCHNGINIGGGMYAPFGVFEKPGTEFLPVGDVGRFTVTKTESDKYVYKVPTLRNITLTAPYFHTGQAWDLRQAVSVMGTSQLGAKLTSAEIDKVVDFLESLTGDQPQVIYPMLPPGVAATPRPQP